MQSCIIHDIIVFKIAQCREVSSPHNGQVTVSSGDGIVEGSIMRFTCKEGYILQGINSSFATCKGGLWTPDPSAITCSGKSCTIWHHSILKFIRQVLSNFDTMSTATCPSLADESSGCPVMQPLTAVEGYVSHYCCSVPDGGWLIRTVTCSQDGTWAPEVTCPQTPGLYINL